MIHSPTAVKRWDQHNYRMGILRAAFDQLGMALAHPSLVLATFVHTLGGSNTLVGLLGPLRFGGWLLPQVLVASWIQPLPRKLPYCIALAVIRGLCYAFMGAAVVLIPRTDLLLAMFFALFLISRLAGGSGAVARWDVIGKIVPPDRRNAFFSQSSFWGGALAFVAGFLVRYVLDERHTWSFRFNYTLLFFLAFTSFGLGAMVFFQVHEPVLTDGRDQASGFARLLREASHLLQRDRRYRRFLVVLALLGMARIANPFYVVFAQE
ncbi:MAG TPA: hypothetical protein EYH31_03595, partial [Anaerolineae bacterium]|nr:hypothetical protein [Anaerolineae bacterium]